MNSSNSVSGPSPSIAPPTRSFLVLLIDGTRLRVSSSDLAAQLRQERSAALKQLRQARAEALAQAADGVSEARIRSAFEANERAMDAAIRRLSKQVRVKPEPKRRSSPEQSPRSRSRRTGHGGLVLVKRAHATSALARRDRLGREGLMLRIRYVRAGGKHASPGCLRRHWFYIAREAAVTLDSDGEPILLGNLGDTIDEVAEGVALQEQVLRATRKNAKLGFRMVGAFPYDFPVDARREVLQRIGDELFGKRGLPWSSAAHDADPAAEVDNPHFHLDYGLLPMTRQPDGSYIVSNDLRTDLDGQEGLRFIRHMVAHVMTNVAHEHGLERTFTALSYRERGMDREGGEHIGQEATAAQRRGEYVASVARNEAKRRRDEAREKARKARERLDALERLKRAIATNAAQGPSTMVPALEMDVSATMPTAPVMNDLPDLVDTFSANLSLHQPGRDLPPVMPPPNAVPHVDAGPVIFSFPAFDVRDVATLPPIIQVSAEAPPIPTLPALAGIVATAASVATPPRLVSVGKASPQTAPLPRPARLGAPAPIMMVPPKAMNVGTAPPRIAQIGKLHAILAPVPAFPAPPPLVAVGDRLPVMQSPPVLRHIGKQAPRLLDPLATIWDIGPAIATDPGDDAVEARLKAAVAAIVAAREATAAQSFDPAASAMVPQRRAADKPALYEAARAAALEALRLRDDWVRYDERGYYTCSDKALGAVGLTRTDIITPAAQAAIKAIGEGQVDRFDPVFDEPSVRSPFRFDQGALRLDVRFGAKLQADVARWSSDPDFQSFVARIWPLTFTDRAAAPDLLTPASGAQPQSPAQAAASPIDPWMQAAAVRQRAMAEWDEIERSDGVGMARLGRILSRPGKSASLNALPSAPQDRTPVGLHPGMFPGGGGSIGG